MSPSGPSVGLAISTFGSEAWRQRGAELLVGCQDMRNFDYAIHTHASTLAEARNEGAKRCGRVGCDWVVNLDADDQLTVGYADAIRAMAATVRETVDILRPATVGFDPATGVSDEDPVMIKRTDLRRANCIVIGAAVRIERLLAVGGFPEYDCLEDWALWRAMVASGSEFEECPEAIYRIGLSAGGRNSDSRLHHDTYRRILSEVPL